MSLGKNIRRMRQDKGWNQLQLCERTGIKVGHISKLEQDEGDPKLSTLHKLMDALECSADSLLLDISKMNRDAILKQTLERALKLPEANKAAIIEVVDGYCRACGMEQNFTEGNKTWLTIYMKAPERIPLPEAKEKAE
ncbi:helix-turn-helix domain-containing protein [Thiocystis violacea]|uniref:helix-turn-helix domain-containing protein n=1 Tax=Thiocystis violacea TaxID=13725 RepID=UPI0023EF03E4|nr:helix-turn-helix transcriptional regulator [Thiocystis violacea]